MPWWEYEHDIYSEDESEDESEDYDEYHSEDNQEDPADPRCEEEPHLVSHLDWDAWHVRFMRKAMIAGIWETIEGNGTPPLPTQPDKPRLDHFSAAYDGYVQKKAIYYERRRGIEDLTSFSSRTVSWDLWKKYECGDRNLWTWYNQLWTGMEEQRAKNPKDTSEQQEVARIGGLEKNEARRVTRLAELQATKKSVVHWRIPRDEQELPPPPAEPSEPSTPGIARDTTTQGLDQRQNPAQQPESRKQHAEAPSAPAENNSSRPSMRKKELQLEAIRAQRVDLLSPAQYKNAVRGRTLPHDRFPDAITLPSPYALGYLEQIRRLCGGRRSDAGSRHQYGDTLKDLQDKIRRHRPKIQLVAKEASTIPTTEYKKPEADPPAAQVRRANKEGSKATTTKLGDNVEEMGDTVGDVDRKVPRHIEAMQQLLKILSAAPGPTTEYRRR
ncbi:hypothetical protein GE09DRAFT_1226117 [Coniochaeta sp. 2T2.1]|nr:hypothetical protein GE09DRAFT_1226117 [Coniochaeta sp. 2T2.1]